MSMTPAETPSSPRGARMPRPARRKQLLNAAQQVFVAHGYHAAAMDDIAERAGVSKPVLYQHFPGKLDLYLALLDTHAEGLVRRVREAMAVTTDNKVRVHNAISAYFGFVDGEGEAVRRPVVQAIDRAVLATAYPETRRGRIEDQPEERRAVRA